MESAPLSSLNRILPAAPTTFRSTRCTVYLWTPLRLVVSRVVGSLSADGAQAIELAARRSVTEHRRIVTFHDWEEMADYESAARAKLVQLGVDLFKVTDAVHMLTSSKLVELAVRAASMAIPSIRMHKTRESFEEAIRASVAESSRR